MTCIADSREASYVLLSHRTAREYPICGKHADVLRRPLHPNWSLLVEGNR